MADTDEEVSFALDELDTGDEAFVPEAQAAADRAVAEAVEAQKTAEPTPIAEPEVPEPQTDVTPEPSTGAAVQETDQQLNFKKLRNVVAEERQRAQKLEQELQQARMEKAAMEAVQRQQATQNVPQETQLPDFNEDPQAWLEAKLAQEHQNMQNTLFNASEVNARAMYGDEEVNRRFGVYQQLAARDPSIQQRVTSSSSPWLTMCDTVKSHEAMSQLQEIGDLDSFREQVRKEVLAEIEQAQTGNVPASSQVAPGDIPPPLANVTSVQAPNPLEAADANDDEILWGHREGGAPY